MIINGKKLVSGSADPWGAAAMASDIKKLITLFSLLSGFLKPIDLQPVLTLFKPPARPKAAYYGIAGTV